MIEIEILKIIIAIIAIVSGLATIIVFVGNVELIIGLISLSFGVLAIIWTLRASNKLSKGSSLKKYADIFLISLIFLVLFSVWHTFAVMFSWKGLLKYIEYFFITVVYVLFVFAAYEIFHLGKEFGFSEQASIIKKTMKKNKLNNGRK